MIYLLGATHLPEVWPRVEAQVGLSLWARLEALDGRTILGSLWRGFWSLFQKGALLWSLSEKGALVWALFFPKGPRVFSGP